MKRKLINQALLCGAIGVVFLTPDAQAQSFNPARGNLLWGMREINNGTEGTFDIVVDFGDAQRFIGASDPVLLGGASSTSSYLGSTAVSESRFSVANITGTFGNLDDIFSSTFGINTPGITDNRNLLLSRVRTGNNEGADFWETSGSTAWTRASLFSQNTTGNRMETVRQNAVNNGTDFAGRPGTVEAANSASYNAGTTPFTGYNAAEGNTGAGFGGNSIMRLDLYNVLNGSGPSDYIGFFEFQGDGDMWFIPENFTPIPEPSTYGVIAGLGLLGMALRRRFTAQNA